MRILWKGEKSRDEKESEPAGGFPTETCKVPRRSPAFKRLARVVICDVSFV